MLLLIVICVILGLWLLKKDSKSGEKSKNSTNLDRHLNRQNDSFEELEKDVLIENNIQQAENSYNIDEILKLKNKDFVFRCLYILSEKNRKEDIERLTDVEFCKNRFNMYYAILQKVDFEINDERIFMDNCGYRRYYPEVITLFEQKYIVCNDWFYNNKTNTRDTRTPFVRWIVR